MSVWCQFQIKWVEMDIGHDGGKTITSIDNKKLTKQKTLPPNLKSNSMYMIGV